MRSFGKANTWAIWSVVGLLAILFFISVPAETKAETCTPEQTTAWSKPCGCGWKETKVTNYDYQKSPTDLSSTGWECQVNAYGSGSTEFCCNKGNWTAACGLGWEEPYGPSKNDYQLVKTAVADKQTGWTCESNKYGAAADESCCKKAKAGGAAGGKTAGTALPDTGSTAEWKYQNTSKTGIVLVSCTKDGNCTIADIVQQGINFAKWLMGLAGALFLIVFVYGGAMYLASFGNSAWVTKGKTALTRGAIGIVLVMGAWTVIAYVAASLGYNAASLSGAAGTDEACTKKAGYSCMEVTPEQETGVNATYMCESKLCMSQPKNLKYKCCIAAPHN